MEASATRGEQVAGHGDEDLVLARRATASSRKVLFLSSFLGNTLDWYDFSVYALVAPLAFEELFFPKLNPLTATIAVYATFAVGYASRPIGGLVLGHFGDRIGRKSVLLLTMILMGAVTTLMGFLPTYEKVGISATVILVALRFIQGFALGGETAAASLMVLESAEEKKRGLYGAALQSAGPLGVVLAAAAVFAVTRLPREEMLSWGWRVPFILSAVLVVVGLYTRAQIDESKVFAEKQKSGNIARVPLFETIRDHKRAVLVVLIVSITESTFYYLTAVYSISYITRTLHLGGSVAIGAVAAASSFAFFSVPIFGAMSDRIGRRWVYIAGIVASAIYLPIFFHFLLTRSVLAIVLAVTCSVGIIHAPMYAMFGSFYGELFPTRVRFTGYSIGKAFGTVLGGGLTPMLAAAFVARNDGDPSLISYYYFALAVIALLVVVFLARETREVEIAQ